MKAKEFIKEFERSPVCRAFLKIIIVIAIVLVLLLVFLNVFTNNAKHADKKDKNAKVNYELEDYNDLKVTDKQVEEYDKNDWLFITGVTPSDDGRIHCNKDNGIPLGNHEINDNTVLKYTVYNVVGGDKELLYKSSEIPSGKKITFMPTDFLGKGEYELQLVITALDLDTMEKYSSTTLSYNIII